MTADEVGPVIDAALDQGLNFFDTSDSYGASEERLGQGLGTRRPDVCIATKFGMPMPGVEGSGGGRPEYMRQAIEASLHRLGTDYVDLYLLHRPDPSTRIADTLGAMGDLVREGKVREIGCSGFSAEQLREAHAVGSEPRFVAVQNHYNLLHRDDEKEVLPVCADLGLVYVPFFPLASGVLTGKYRRGEPPPPDSRLELWGDLGRTLVRVDDQVMDRVEALASWAGDHGHTILDLAFAWLTANPVVASVIAGATQPAQVVANAAAGRWTLSPEELAEVSEVVS
jgi:aryl-alcohol dehydrogenase-like predicted oxidoreductase